MVTIKMMADSLKLGFITDVVTEHAIGKFSRWQINDIFLIFARKQDLTFHANWDNLNEMPNPAFWQK